MRRQHRERRSDMPVPVRQRATPDAPSTGYALIVDGQIKSEFSTPDRAIETAKELKKRHPRLQVKVFNHETRTSELIGLVAA
jgi:hypothetical protein